MGNLSATRITLILALGALSILLLLVFFLVYFAGNEVEPVDLTSLPPGDSFQETLPAASSESGTSTLTTGAEEGIPSEEPATALRVYIAGAVQRPDVYALRPGDRLVDVLKAAGGPTESADLEAVNLAVRVLDEGYYYIPTKGAETEDENAPDVQESSTASVAFPPLAADPATGQLPTDTEDPPNTDNSPSLVNLNTASQSELENLPGIGPARSGAIIAYREQNGPFATVEEIMAVSGIGQGIFSNLQHSITVDR